VSPLARATSLVASAVLFGSCASPEIQSARKKKDAAPVAEDDAQASDLRHLDSFFVVNPSDATGGGGQIAPAACPGTGDLPPKSCEALGVKVDPYYAGSYTCYDLGPVPGMPNHKYGGLTLSLDKCSTKLIIAGDANLPDGKLYVIDVARTADGHISGFSGSAKVFADAPSNDGGVAYGPGDVLFVTHWPTNELQQTKPGSVLADKIIPLMGVGVAHASASLAFVPGDFPMKGALKMVSWSMGQWYTMAIKPDGQGTYDVVSARQDLMLPGGPEGFTYVSAGSPLFTRNSILVSEWTDNTIATYESDDSANPKLGTRRDFVVGLRGPEGAYRDPATGDFFFSTWGQEMDDRVVAVRGFAPIIIR
jgi:hypothetical protein